MTVDLLAATFWPEGTLFGFHRPHSQEGEAAPTDPEHPDVVDAATRAEGFWAAMVRYLCRPTELPAEP